MHVFCEYANRYKLCKLIVNKGWIGADRGRPNFIDFVKLPEVKMCPVYLMKRYAYITFVWFGSLCTKQVTRGSPGWGLWLSDLIMNISNNL